MFNSLSHNPLIQFTDRGDLQHISPLFRSHLNLKDLWRCHKKRYLRGCTAFRKLQYEAVIIEHEIKIRNVSCIISHEPIVIVLVILKTIEVHPGNPAKLKKTYLIHHPLAAENLHRVVCTHATLVKRYPGIHKLSHTLPYLSKKLFVNFHSAFHRIVISASYGKMEHHLVHIFFSGYVINCFRQDHTGTSFIGFMPCLIRHCHKL
ncbi:unknown [Blautia hydrogenotrophica CAG:147]|nr:unknown [Blautia hydrogenotrophica CAG:147]